MTPQNYLTIAVVALLAIARPFMPLRTASLPGSYEAVAHIIVGGLFGAWLVNRQRWLLYTFLAFTAVEVVFGIIVPLSRAVL